MKKKKDSIQKAQNSLRWSRDMALFLKQNPDCFILNPHCKSNWAVSIKKIAADDLQNSRRLAVSMFNQKNCAITMGKNHFIVSQSFMDIYVQREGTTIQDLLDTDTIARYGISNWNKRQENKKSNRSKENKSTERVDNWADKTKKSLLKSSTKSEQLVYNAIPKKYRQYANRQHYIVVKGKQYFIDIYLSHLNRAIEVDGGYHTSDMQMKKDKERDNALSSIGIKTYRITNEDVHNPERLKSFMHDVLSVTQTKVRHNVKERI